MREGRPAAKRRAQRSYGIPVRPHRVPLRKEDQESETCRSLSTEHGNRIVKWPTPAPGTGEKEKGSEEGEREPPTPRITEPLQVGITAGNGPVPPSFFSGRRPWRREGLAWRSRSASTGPSEKKEHTHPTAEWRKNGSPHARRLRAQRKNLNGATAPARRASVSDRCERTHQMCISCAAI